MGVTREMPIFVRQVQTVLLVLHVAEWSALNHTNFNRFYKIREIIHIRAMYKRKKACKKNLNTAYLKGLY